MKRIILTSILSLFAVIVMAQPPQTAITVQSAGHEHFWFYLNNALQNERSDEIVVVKDLAPSNYEVTVVMDNREQTTFNTRVQLHTGVNYFEVACPHGSNNINFRTADKDVEMAGQIVNAFGNMVGQMNAMYEADVQRMNNGEQHGNGYNHGNPPASHRPQGQPQAPHQAPHQGPAQPQAPHQAPHQGPAQHQTPHQAPHQGPAQHQTPHQAPHQGQVQPQAPQQAPHQGPAQHQAPHQASHQGPAQHQAPHQAPHQGPAQHQAPHQAPHQMPAPAPVPAPSHGQIPCNENDFRELKDLIRNETFEDSKLTVAKQATASEIFTVDQLAEIASLFTFEATKLEYLKFAYDFCMERSKYYKLNKVFTYSSSIDELNEYIRGR